MSRPTAPGAKPSAGTGSADPPHRTDADCGHAHVDHTADLALHLWAPTEEQLLAEGARALVGLLCNAGSVAQTATRSLELDALDREDRLVRFLNEILWLANVEGFLVAHASIELDDAGLRASLLGESDALDRVAVELKSVTYHDLSLTHEAGSWSATITIDV